MSPSEKLTELLTAKKFSHGGEEFEFRCCKVVYSNLMILTNKKTLQIPLDQFVNFYQKVEGNCMPVGVIAEKKEIVSKDLPLKAVVVPEVPRVFEKINSSFEVLIDLIDNATEADLKTLETKANMLTSVAQTAVNMENSRINLIKMLNR